MHLSKVQGSGVSATRVACRARPFQVSAGLTARAGAATLLLALGAPSLSATNLLTARLVADVGDQLEWHAGGEVANLTSHAGRIYFSTPTRPGDRRHWWSTDGSSAGLRLESALNEGPGVVRSLVSSDGPLYAVVRTEPWQSHIGSLQPGAGAASWSTAINSFHINPYAFGRELIYWLDGNLFHVRESDLQNSQLTQGLTVAPASPQQLGTRLLFIDDGSYDTLWETDGTPVGTRPIASLAGADLHVQHSSVEDGRYWAILKGCGSIRVASSDGTAGGTTHAYRVTSAGCPGLLSNMVVKGGVVYFFENHQPGGPPAASMWKSDGTPAGTVHLGTIDRHVSRLVLLGDQLVLTVDGSHLPHDFYRATIVADMATFSPILASGMPVQVNPEFETPPLLSLNGKVFFACGEAFCATSHEDNSLVQLAPVFPTASSRSVSTGGKAYFKAGVAENLGLWTSEGAPQSSSFVTATVATSGNGFYYPNDSQVPIPHQSLHGRMVVRGGNTCPQPSPSCPTSFLLSTGGSSESTALLEQSGDARFIAIAGLGDQLFFTAETVQQSFLYSASPQLDNIALHASNMYSSASLLISVPQATTPFVLFGCSRSQSGSSQRGACAFSPSSAVGQQWVWPHDNGTCTMRAVGSIGHTGLFFSTCLPQRSLVAATGTANSGVLLASLFECQGSPQPFESLQFGDRLYFCARGENAEFGLWRSDGTPSGTERLTTLAGPASGFSRHEDGIVFRVGYPMSPGMQVLRFDVQSGDTVQLLPASQNAVTAPTLLGSRIHWVESRSQNTQLHWVSDGTVPGTHIAPAVDSLKPTGAFTPMPAGYGERWKGIFPCTSLENGSELCATDEHGMERILAADIARGSAGSGAGGLMSDGAKLFFLANDGRLGTELYVADPDWISEKGFEIEEAL